MKMGPGFLPQSEWEEFQKPGRAVPRSVVLPREGNVLNFSNTPQNLSELLGKELAHSGQAGRWFRCWSISVRADDGMTWTAESVRQALGKAYLGFHYLCLPNRPTADGLPAMTRLIGPKAFLRLAARRRVTSSFLTLRSWMTPAVLALSFGLALALKLLDVLWKAHSPQSAAQIAPAIIDSTFWTVGAVSAAAGIVSQQVATWLTTRTKSKSMENFLANLPGKQKTGEYRDLIEDLARELRAVDFPRIVIVDHFEGLDFTTQEVVDRYFRNHSQEARGSELWIVFEEAEQKSFSGLMSLAPEEYGYARTKRARLVPLGRPEKQKLAALLGLDESAVEFHSVKHVCQQQTRAERRFAALFRDYRHHHPASSARYTDLDFLYLLALTAIPGQVLLTDRFVRNNFAAKTGLHPVLLRQFLCGTKLIKTEFEQQLLAVRRQFESVLVIDNEGGDAQLRVLPEAAEQLESVAEELRLPPRGLGHLFWAVFWFEILSQQPVQAVWMRKLARHVLEADVSLCAESDAPAALANLIDVALFTLRGCFRTCVLGPIPPLIERLLVLLDTAPPEETTTQRATMSELCGGIYMVLAEKTALRAFLELTEKPARPGPTLVAAHRNELVVSDLEPLIRNFMLVAPAGLWASPAVEQLRLRATWLGLTLYRLLDRSADAYLLRVAADSYGHLDEIHERVRHRAARRDANPLRVGEMAGLSLALWCSALQVRTGWDALLPAPDMKTLDTAGIALLLQEAHSRGPYERLMKLVDFAGNCLALITPKPGNSGPGTNFIAEALARDVAVTAAASVVLGCHLLDKAHGMEWPEEAQPRIAAALSAASAALQYDLEAAGDRASVLSDETRHRIDELMQLGSVVWHAFGMDQMRHFMTVRRAHFGALCRQTPIDSADELLLGSEGAVLDRTDFTGLIANSVTADCLMHAGELTAFYLRRAASIALEGDFGRPLRREMAGLAIEHGHALGFDLVRFVREMLDTELDGETLRTQLQASGPNLARVSLKYLNAAASSPDEALPAVANLIRAEIERRGEGPELDDVRALLELNRLTSVVRAGKTLDAQVELKTCRAHARSWLYPSLLRILYGHSRAEHVRREAVRVLDHNPRTDESNCCLLLAAGLMRDFPNGRSPDAQIVRHYLKAGIGHWQRHLTADMNVAIYKSLCNLDPENRTVYMPFVVRWQAIQVHRDHLRRIPEFLAQGRFFLIFADYVRSNEFWGLRADLDPQTLWERQQANEAERRRAVAEWRQRGAPIPAALLVRAREIVVSSEFLVLGTYLFEPPLDSDKTLADERANYNQEAERNLLRLLQAVIALPDLPQAIRDLLCRHSERLYRYSLPPDLPERALSRAAVSR